jgi:hypothetical protein
MLFHSFLVKHNYNSMAYCHIWLLVCQFLDEHFLMNWIGFDAALAWPPLSPDLTLLVFFFFFPAGLRKEYYLMQRQFWTFVH